MQDILSLNGKWNIIKAISSGIEGATPKGTYLYIQENLFERHTPKYIFTREMELNRTTNPFQIDLHITNEPELGKTFLGIFKLEGDILTIAHSLPNFPRPTSFLCKDEQAMDFD